MMYTNSHSVKPQYQQAISKVLNYINQNLAGDVSLDTLARIANYSPFHFQKIFSDSILETPKQYVIRLRLERAAHFMLLFPNLAIQEIAAGCGFSSNSIFSRAFKNFYGISAELYKGLSHEELYKINNRKNQFIHLQETSWITPITNIQKKNDTVKIASTPIVKTIYPFKIAAIQTTLSHKENISFAFKSLLQWAIPQNLITSSTRYFGIWLDFPFITPYDKCRYLCGIDLGIDIKASKGIDVLDFKKGQYINYEMTGDINETLESLISLNHSVIDSLGYTISEMICYEQFEENPAKQSYEKIARNLMFPIKIK